MKINYTENISGVTHAEIYQTSYGLFSWRITIPGKTFHAPIQYNTAVECAEALAYWLKAVSY